MRHTWQLIDIRRVCVCVVLNYELSPMTNTKVRNWISSRSNLYAGNSCLKYHNMLTILRSYPQDRQSYMKPFSTFFNVLIRQLYQRMLYCRMLYFSKTQESDLKRFVSYSILQSSQPSSGMWMFCTSLNKPGRYSFYFPPQYTCIMVTAERIEI